MTWATDSKSLALLTEWGAAELAVNQHLRTHARCRVVLCEIRERLRGAAYEAHDACLRVAKRRAQVVPSAKHDAR